ncbi:MAG: methyl-accepting chemotaxis protein [Nitrosopumilus sp. B06]|nr:MAG: methyl-accepting chemotaxis protein [Nitrosopumilus sp. B06]
MDCMVAVKKPKVKPREPTPAALLKKVATVSDSNKALQKEIKVMTRVFGENQKVLVSLKSMIDSLATTLDHIQKQSRRMGIVEEDTQKLYAGLRGVRAQSGLVERINGQTERLRKEMADLQKSGPAGLSKKVDEGINSIRNNSEMIIKIAQRIDEVRDDLKNVSGRADSLARNSTDIDKLHDSIEKVSGRMQNLEASSQVVESFRKELARIAESTQSASSLGSELVAIKAAIDAVSEKSSGMNQLAGIVDGIKSQFDSVSEKTGKIGELESKMSRIEEGIKSVSEAVKRQDASAAELHARSEKLFSDMQQAKGAAGKTSEDSSKEVLALLKLSEFQSSIRMNAESKYGVAADLEKMAAQTTEIVNLFDRLSIESGQKMPLPHEVRQWAVGKILDCADRWEVRFGDVYSILSNAIGRDMLKESIRTRQVRDIYGIRAVDELRTDLGIS